MDRKDKTRLTYNSENLAVPEVITGKVDERNRKKRESIFESEVAIPEVHIKKK